MLSKVGFRTFSSVRKRWILGWSWDVFGCFGASCPTKEFARNFDLECLVRLPSFQFWCLSSSSLFVNFQQTKAAWGVCQGCLPRAFAVANMVSSKERVFASLCRVTSTTFGNFRNVESFVSVFLYLPFVFTSSISLSSLTPSLRWKSGVSHRHSPRSSTSVVPRLPSIRQAVGPRAVGLVALEPEKQIIYLITVLVSMTLSTLISRTHTKTIRVTPQTIKDDINSSASLSKVFLQVQ